MASTPLSYWTPGDEERRLRIFISHRHDKDEALYNEVIAALNREGFAVQDISLPASQVMAGPQGGQLPELKIQAEIAARIYTSDILIAPSTSGVSQSHWVTWEVQLAAIGYGIPILFVNQKDQQRKTRLVTEAGTLGLRHAVCEPVTQHIVSNVASLCGRPKWAMRQKEENDQLIRFRGPPQFARDNVLRKFPFEPRLAAVDPPPDAPKGGSWNIFR